MESFKCRVISNYRITIPRELVYLMEIKKGDFLKVSIEKVKERK